MITIQNMLIWFILGISLLSLMFIYFLLIYIIFKEKDKNETSLTPIFICWAIPTSLFLGFLAHQAYKYLVLLHLIQ